MLSFFFFILLAFSFLTFGTITDAQLQSNSTLTNEVSFFNEYHQKKHSMSKTASTTVNPRIFIPQDIGKLAPKMRLKQLLRLKVQKQLVKTVDFTPFPSNMIPAIQFRPKVTIEEIGRNSNEFFSNVEKVLPINFSSIFVTDRLLSNDTENIFLPSISTTTLTPSTVETVTKSASDHFYPSNKKLLPNTPKVADNSGYLASRHQNLIGYRSNGMPVFLQDSNNGFFRRVSDKSGKFVHFSRTRNAVKTIKNKNMFSVFPSGYQAPVNVNAENTKNARPKNSENVHTENLDESKNSASTIENNFSIIPPPDPFIKIDAKSKPALIFGPMTIETHSGINPPGFSHTLILRNKTDFPKFNLDHVYDEEAGSSYASSQFELKKVDKEMGNTTNLLNDNEKIEDNNGDIEEEKFMENTISEQESLYDSSNLDNFLSNDRKVHSGIRKESGKIAENFGPPSIQPLFGVSGGKLKSTPPKANGIGSCFLIRRNCLLINSTPIERRISIDEKKCMKMCRKMLNCGSILYAEKLMICDIFPFEIVKRKSQFVKLKGYHYFVIDTSLPNCERNLVIGNMLKSTKKLTKLTEFCKDGMDIVFQKVEHSELIGSDGPEYGPISKEECTLACLLDMTPDGEPFQCLTVDFLVETQTCILSNEAAKPTRFGVLKKAENTTYLEKTCLFEKFSSRCSDRHIERWSQKVLIGFGEDVKSTNSIAECLDLCFQAVKLADVRCLSIMYFYEEKHLNCMLNSESRLTEPASFINELENRVEYLGIDNCLDIPNIFTSRWRLSRLKNNETTVSLTDATSKRKWMAIQKNLLTKYRQSRKNVHNSLDSTSINLNKKFKFDNNKMGKSRRRSAPKAKNTSKNKHSKPSFLPRQNIRSFMNKTLHTFDVFEHRNFERNPVQKKMAAIFGHWTNWSECDKNRNGKRRRYRQCQNAIQYSTRERFCPFETQWCNANFQPFYKKEKFDELSL